MPYGLSDLPFFLMLPALLIASGFFSGSETALFSLSPQQIYQLSRKKDVTSRIACQLLAQQQQLLITLMFGNMTINVLYFVICSALLLKLDPTHVSPIWIVIGTFGPLALIIVFGEILPKLLANTVALKWVRVVAVPLYSMHRIIAPVGEFLATWVITPLGRLLAPTNKPSQMSTEELETLIHLSESRGVIGQDEQALLQEVVNLSELKVRDVMIPRVDMVAVDITAPPHKVFDVLQADPYSRVFVYRNDLDHIEGVLFAREFLLAWRKNRSLDWRRLIRQVQFVPEIQKLDYLLESFRKWREKLAIAVDEYGGTAGMISLKDVVEEILGDLDMDDSPGESPDSAVQQVRSNAWRVSGALSIHDWAEAFGQKTIPPRISTVGGLVTALLGGIPKPGDRVMIENLEMIVENVHQRRVKSVVLQLPDSNGGGMKQESKQGGEG